MKLSKHPFKHGPSFKIFCGFVQEQAVKDYETFAKNYLQIGGGIP